MCALVSTKVCVRVRTCVCMYVCILCVRIFEGVCVRARARVCMYVCLWLHVCE